MENKNGEYFIPINEVAKRLDVPAHTLRYWEKQFASAIRPITGAGGRRYYRQDTIDKIEAIKSLLYDKGMTITGVKKILHNGSFDEEVSGIKKDSIPNSQKKLKANTDEIDFAIDLLKQAKMFLD